jgi:valyl-tRNA synthetase
MARLQEIIIAARNAKAELKTDAKKPTRARYHLASPQEKHMVAANLQTICRLAALSELTPGQPPFDLNLGAIRSGGDVEIYVMKEEVMDLQSEAARLRRDIANLAKDIQSKQRQLADETFRSRAPENVVKSMESKLAERTMEHQKLSERLTQLEKSASA